MLLVLCCVGIVGLGCGCCGLGVFWCWIVNVCWIVWWDGWIVGLWSRIFVMLVLVFVVVWWVGCWLLLLCFVRLGVVFVEVCCRFGSCLFGFWLVCFRYVGCVLVVFLGFLGWFCVYWGNCFGWVWWNIFVGCVLLGCVFCLLVLLFVIGWFGLGYGVWCWDWSSSCSCLLLGCISVLVFGLGSRDRFGVLVLFCVIVFGLVSVFLWWWCGLLVGVCRSFGLGDRICCGRFCLGVCRFCFVLLVLVFVLVVCWFFFLGYVGYVVWGFGLGFWWLGRIVGLGVVWVLFWVVGIVCWWFCWFWLVFGLLGNNWWRWFCILFLLVVVGCGGIWCGESVMWLVCGCVVGGVLVFVWFRWEMFGIGFWRIVVVCWFVFVWWSGFFFGCWFLGRLVLVWFFLVFVWCRVVSCRFWFGFSVGVGGWLVVGWGCCGGFWFFLGSLFVDCIYLFGCVFVSDGSVCLVLFCVGSEWGVGRLLGYVWWCFLGCWVMGWSVGWGCCVWCWICKVCVLLFGIVFCCFV